MKKVFALVGTGIALATAVTVTRAKHEYTTIKFFSQSKAKTFKLMGEFLNGNNVSYVSHYFDEEGLILLYKGLAAK